MLAAEIWRSIASTLGSFEGGTCCAQVSVTAIRDTARTKTARFIISSAFHLRTMETPAVFRHVPELVPTSHQVDVV
jgi:hypothetical protein